MNMQPSNASRIHGMGAPMEESQTHAPAVMVEVYNNVPNNGYSRGDGETRAVTDPRPTSGQSRSAEPIPTMQKTRVRIRVSNATTPA